MRIAGDAVRAPVDFGWGIGPEVFGAEEASEILHYRYIWNPLSDLELLEIVLFYQVFTKLRDSIGWFYCLYVKSGI